MFYKFSSFTSLHTHLDITQNILSLVSIVVTSLLGVNFLIFRSTSDSSFGYLPNKNSSTLKNACNAECVSVKVTEEAYPCMLFFVN